MEEIEYECEIVFQNVSQLVSCLFCLLGRVYFLTKYHLSNIV